MMVGAMLSSCESRRWGDCDDNDGKEEVVEVDNNETTTMSTPPPPATGGGGTHGGGGGNDWDDVAVLHRWRLDVGNANADGVDAMAGCGNR